MRVQTIEENATRDETLRTNVEDMMARLEALEWTQWAMQQETQGRVWELHNTQSTFRQDIDAKINRDIGALQARMHTEITAAIPREMQRLSSTKGGKDGKDCKGGDDDKGGKGCAEPKGTGGEQ